MVWVLATEEDRQIQCGIVQGKRNSSGHHCMHGIYNIEHCVIIWYFSNVSMGYILGIFNRHCSTMNIAKGKQGGRISTGYKR